MRSLIRQLFIRRRRPVPPLARPTPPISELDLLRALGCDL